ncbi:glutamyl-tRNA reductase [Auritidibacter sp. NML100628]|uniref:glutamyl-tRNA reductase n=1 Tax=Auritidibacter sp. NML100628 TaxID=2170742 RepID=UPI000D73AC77|nr:glutamyl-tRNA reductase [Auritidibacter sp. NML100628]PXA77411.1 glutamyl-tRNA reductase [Auritidibacter sp. NML100628]
MEVIVALFSLVAAHTWLDLETVAELSNGVPGVASTVENSPHLQGAVSLSTCNRVEVYAEIATGADAAQAQVDILQSIADQTGLRLDQVRDAFHILPHDETVRHLFEVGAGLKSAVVGEREIAGQVRRALTEAKQANTTTGNLTKLFETASRTAKQVGTETALGSTGRSVVSVALELATQIRAGSTVVATKRFWEDANVLLVGTGAYAGTTIAQLEQLGARNVAVYSSSGRAEQFVADRGDWAMAVDSDMVHEAFAEADVVIGVSGQERTISKPELQRLRSGLPHRLTIIDLALSHDFDPDIADLDGVDVVTLESVKMAAPDEQQESITRAKGLVDQAVEDFLSESKQRSASDAIVTLREHTQSVLEDEIARVRQRHGCTAAAEEVELAMRRMVRQLLHEPTVRARHLAEEGRLADYELALETIFGLDVAAETAERQRKKAERQAARKRAQTPEQTPVADPTCPHSDHRAESA